jgi:hypothetical protein
MRYIDENEGFVNTLLSDLDRVRVIRHIFSQKDKKFETDTYFAEFTKIPYKTVNIWRKPNKGNLSEKNKLKISEAFGLTQDIWQDTIYDEHVLKDKLLNGEYIQDLSDNKLANKFKKIDRIIIGEVATLSTLEKEKIEELKKYKTIPIVGNLQTYSSDFIYKLATILKDNNQAQDALSVLEIIDKKSDNFKYAKSREIMHLRAILLSHKDIQKWDEAINILRYLYAFQYHHWQPEIITLWASNNKRKALYNPNGKLNPAEFVDLEALSTAYLLYNEAYKAKKLKDRYYDAVNIAYLKLLIENLDKSDESKLNLNLTELYQKTFEGDFRINNKDWWESISKIEFLLLLGRDSEAEIVLENFKGDLSNFDLDTTLRQLNIYLNYVDDPLIKDFVEFIKSKFKN